MPLHKAHFATMDSTEAESEELFLEQEPEERPPPYFAPSRATKSNHQDDIEGNDNGEEQGEKHQCEEHQDEEHQEEDDEGHSDEDSVDEEFKDKVREELDRFRRPYIPDREPPPRNYAAYHPSFAKVETLCAEVFEEAVTLLESSEYQDKYTLQLLDMINRKQSIKYGPPSRVGFIGDSGAGKSKSQHFDNTLLTPQRQKLTD